MKRLDRLSSQLRTIESEVDNHFLTNPLVALDLASAMRYLLIRFEASLQPFVGTPLQTRHELEAKADNLINDINHPFGWLYRNCQPEGKISNILEPGFIHSADELLKLAANYDIFVRVFTYASRGIIQLEVEGDTLTVQHSLDADTRYEAYNRLIKPARASAKLGSLERALFGCIRFFSPDEFLRRLIRYSGVSETEVLAILEDLTYGSSSIQNPDPVIQPIFRLGSDTIFLIPSLWVNSSIERNFTVLVNRLPRERLVYAQLTNQKESIMRTRAENEITNKDYRTINGKIPGRPDLPDIDLAVISDAEKLCILVELKWFIDPAEPRELLERSEELEKGVQQIKTLINAHLSGATELWNKLVIRADYSVVGAVLSANWIGYASVQDPLVPIVLDLHFSAKIKASGSLEEVSAWLGNRNYLPILDEHYRVVETPTQVGHWKVRWYGLKSLLSGQFFPL
jgi:hypothetical protein